MVKRFRFGDGNSSEISGSSSNLSSNTGSDITDNTVITPEMQGFFIALGVLFCLFIFVALPLIIVFGDGDNNLTTPPTSPNIFDTTIDTQPLIIHEGDTTELIVPITIDTTVPTKELNCLELVGTMCKFFDSSNYPCIKPIGLANMFIEDATLPTLKMIDIVKGYESTEFYSDPESNEKFPEQGIKVGDAVMALKSDTPKEVIDNLLIEAGKTSILSGSVSGLAFVPGLIFYPNQTNTIMVFFVDISKYQGYDTCSSDDILVNTLTPSPILDDLSKFICGGIQLWAKTSTKVPEMVKYNCF